MMDKVLQGLDKTEVHYLDDMLIHTKGSLDEHCEVVEVVLHRLVDNNLVVNLGKSEFHIKETTFLGFVINGNETKMKSNKLDIIRDWPQPMTKKQTQMFFRFANYYRHFISHYSKIAHSLTHITENVSFSWKSEQQAA